MATLVAAPRDTGLTPIGNGVGAGFRDGMVFLLTGPDFAAIERERRDGPRYAEAIRCTYGVRTEIWRSHWWHLPPDEQAQRPSVLLGWPPQCSDAERSVGIPLGWFGR